MLHRQGRAKTTAFVARFQAKVPPRATSRAQHRAALTCRSAAALARSPTLASFTPRVCAALASAPDSGRQVRKRVEQEIVALEVHMRAQSTQAMPAHATAESSATSPAAGSLLHRACDTMF